VVFTLNATQVHQPPGPFRADDPLGNPRSGEQDGPVDGVLRTDQLDLEPLRIEHADEMAPLLDDHALHWYIGGRPLTRAKLGERYARLVLGGSSDGTQRWLNWVVRRRDGRQPVGTIQATITATDDGPCAEVAWVIAVPFQGHGYATEAARAMVASLREQGIVHVIAHVHPDHQASAAVARAIGLVATDTVVDGEIRWRG
jgi:RimJ/RimL family protein N-acetyltransferase